MDVTRIADQLKALRLSAGLTQADLADRVGIDRSFVSYIERGKRETTLSQLERFASECGGEVVVRPIVATEADHVARAVEDLDGAGRAVVARIAGIWERLPSEVREALEDDVERWERHYRATSQSASLGGNTQAK